MPGLRPALHPAAAGPAELSASAHSAGLHRAATAALTAGLSAAVVVALVVAVYRWPLLRRSTLWVWPVLPTLLLASTAFGALPRLPTGAQRAGAELSAAGLPAAVGRALLPTGAVVSFFIPLVAGWESGRTRYGRIGGLLPWSDASAYFRGAEMLLLRGELDEWNSRRPLNAVLFAVRLGLTGLDLRLALLLQALLLGLACYLAARAVAHDLGTLAGWTLFAGLWLFGAFVVDLTLSESLGLTFGALAFASLWRAAASSGAPQPLLVAGGLFLLAVALNVRAGAFLVLPVLVAWFGWRSRSTRVVAAGLAAVIGSFALNVGVVQLFGGDPGNLNGNFSYVLYGLASGGKGWTRITVDHPEIRQMTEAARNDFIYQRAFQKLAEDPSALGRGLYLGTRTYVVNAFSLALSPDWAATAAKRSVPPVALLLLGTAMAARVAVRRRAGLQESLTLLALVLALPVLLGLWAGVGTPAWLAPGVVAIAAAVLRDDALGGPGQRSFLLVGSAAVIASVAFLPDGGLRVFAATAPFAALTLVAVVLSLRGSLAAALAGATRAPRPARPARPADALHQARGWAPVAAGVALVATAVVVGPAAMALVPDPHPAVRTCPPGRPAMPLAGGASVQVSAGEAPGITEVGASDFTAEPGFNHTEVATTLRTVRPPTTVLTGLVLDEQLRHPLIVLDGLAAAPGTRVAYLCGDTRPDPGYPPGVVHATSLRP